MAASSAALSADEFQRLQSELILLKSTVYEGKERERRANAGGS
jgi:hypothetical protein